jgi:hypothetical protein
MTHKNKLNQSNVSKASKAFNFTAADSSDPISINEPKQDYLELYEILAFPNSQLNR